MDKSGDRRIRKTKEALKNGLMELIMEKPMNKITVKELVDRADLNRSTFYKYYADIPDMIEKIEIEVYKEILNIIQIHILNKKDSNNDEDIEKHALEFMEELCMAIKNNFNFFECILSKNGDIVFAYKIEELIEEYTIEQLKEILKDKVNHLPYIYSFFKSGCLGILKRWMSEGCRESAKEIAEITFKFGESIVRSCKK